jgi:hypothetical protein
MRNGSKIKHLALAMEGLGSLWIDPTRTTLARS